MQKEIDTGWLDFFRNTCREHKVKITPQRTVIFEELIRSKDHPSADILFREVRERFPNISFDTVYRTLMTFVQIGIADVVEGYGDRRRFDPNMDPHHHVHCVTCGKIIDFASPEYDNLDVPKDIQDAFVITNKKVVINGICKKCNKQT